MSPAHVLAPTYRRLKRALMDGAWPSGFKLEAQRLADEFGVSMTPVRDSLNQLVGEGLVDFTPGEGFRVASIGEQALRDLLYVNALLLEAAAGADWKLPRRSTLPEAESDYAERLTSAFATLAGGSGNRQLVGIVDGIGERLHPYRHREPEIIPAVVQILEAIEASIDNTAEERRNAIWRYHRECAAHAADLIEAVAA